MRRWAAGGVRQSWPTRARLGRSRGEASSGVLQVSGIAEPRDEVDAAIGSVRIKVGEEFPEVLNTLGCERHDGNIVIEVQDPQAAVLRLHIHRNVMEPLLVLVQASWRRVVW